MVEKPEYFDSLSAHEKHDIANALNALTRGEKWRGCMWDDQQEGVLLYGGNGIGELRALAQHFLLKYDEKADESGEVYFCLKGDANAARETIACSALHQVLGRPVHIGGDGEVYCEGYAPMDGGTGEDELRLYRAGIRYQVKSPDSLDAKILITEPAKVLFDRAIWMFNRWQVESSVGQRRAAGLEGYEAASCKIESESAENAGGIKIKQQGMNL